MRLRVVAFAGLSLGLLLSSCWSDDQKDVEPEDRSREGTPPESCELFKSPTPFCTPMKQSAPTGGAGSEGAPGGAAGMGGGAPSVPEPEPGCLIDQDVTLRCPSAVGMLSFARGQDETVDVLVGQKGRSALDRYGSPTSEQLAYVDVVRFDGATSELRKGVAEPFVVTSPPERVLRLLAAGAGADTAWLSHDNQSDGSSKLSVASAFDEGEAPKTLSVATPLRASAWTLRTNQGEGVLVESNAFEGISIFRGLPNEPELLALPAATAVAVTTNAAGELRALVHRTTSISELVGDGLGETGFSLPAESGVNFPTLDLLYVGEGAAETPVVLTRNGSSDSFGVRFIDDVGQPSAPAFLGRYENDCDDFYIGLICDECPEGQACHARLDLAIDAKLFTQDGRVYVAYLAIDQVEQKVIDLEETGFGLGCSCTPDDVSTEQTADVLIVAEVRPPAPNAAPQVIERMRQEIGPAHTAGSLWLAPGPRGTLDVAFGPALSRFDSGLADFPESPTEFRVLRIDPSVIEP